MITGDSESLCKKAYLRPGGKGLSSVGGLEGSSVSSRGSDSVGFSSSSSMKNSVTFFLIGFYEMF
jgi:hypothetical protein